MPWQNEKAQAAAASGPCARESERRVVCQRPLNIGKRDVGHLGRSSGAVGNDLCC
jgi:hypothetical protein